MDRERVVSRLELNCKEQGLGKRWLHSWCKLYKTSSEAREFNERGILNVALESIQRADGQADEVRASIRQRSQIHMGLSFHQLERQLSLSVNFQKGVLQSEMTLLCSSAVLPVLDDSPHPNLQLAI